MSRTLLARGRHWAGALLVALIAGCGDAAAPDQLAGAWWAGRSDAVRELLLGELAQLEGTPLARRAREIAEALPACEGALGVHAPDGDPARLAEPAHCLADGEPLAVALERAGGELAFALPTAGGELRGALNRGADELALDLHWTDPPSDGALALLLPGEQPAGPDRLANTGRLVHVRVRPRAGLDLTAFVPSGSQADQLFRLQSGLFASRVLDGTWEGAVYLPERTGAMPGIVLALDFRLRSAAIAAAERMLSELQKTWPVRRTELHLRSGADGACLLDLNVLPELAPCYVTTRETLLVGWNRASLEHALASAGARDGGEPGRLDVDLALIQQADGLVARHLPGAERVLRWPWTRIAVTGAQREDELALRILLRAQSRSSS